MIAAAPGVDDLSLSTVLWRRKVGSQQKAIDVYIGSLEVQECVAFLGYEDPDSPGGIKPRGTGFLINYHGFGYLLTARHIAEELGGDPFCLRINRPGGGVTFELKDNVKWLYHPDKTVDIAAIEFNPEGEERFQKRFMNWEMLLSSKRIKELDIQPGCICYVVGLFRFLQGSSRNLPLVYTGNVANLDISERVPFYDERSRTTQHHEVYMIEAHGIDGLSGSPVFVRQTKSLTYQNQNGETQTVLVPSNDLDLLGLFMGAWFLPPDQVVAATYHARRESVVPTGIGMVVPADKILELFEVADIKTRRQSITGKS